VGQDLIVTRDDAHDPAVLHRLYQDLSVLPRMPAALLYIPMADLERLAAGDKTVASALAAYVPESLVAFLPAHVDKVRAMAPNQGDLVGVEVFLSRHASMDHTPHGGLHVDANEPDWDSALVRWGSVFHLGPDNVPEGGGTAVYPRLPVPEQLMSYCFRYTTHDELDALAADWTVVPQKPNRLLVFDGRLPHYACRCRAKPEAPRTALIVTGWATVPRCAPERGYSKLTVEQYQAFTHLPESDVQRARGFLELGRERGARVAQVLVDALSAIESI
jgi:hypothetical protein